MIYGYEDYNIKWLESYYFKNTPYLCSVRLSRSIPYMLRNNVKLRMFGGSKLEQQLYTNTSRVLCNLPDILSKTYTPKDGDILFFDKACAIPRIKCESKWRRTIKISKADTIVVPDTYNLSAISDTVVFKDSQTKTLYIIIGEITVPTPSIGQSFGEWHDSIQHQILPISLQEQANIATVEEVSNAVCIYTGAMFKYKLKDQFLFNIIDGIYPKIICENNLLQLIDSEEGGLTSDLVDSLIELLKSPDIESVHQGLRILSNLEYIHYPCTAKYILNSTKSNWNRYSPFNTSVEFMLKQLYPWHNPFEKVSSRESQIAIEILNKTIKKDIEKSLTLYQQRTNMTIKIKNIDFEILPPENSMEQSSESPKDDN